MSEPQKTENASKDDPVAEVILTLLQEAGSGQSITPETVARHCAAARAKPGDAPDAWRRFLLAARQQALHLARDGRITILRKGKAVDPRAPVKGIIRLTLPD